MPPIASPSRTGDPGHRALPGRVRVRERAQGPARGERRDPASGIHHGTRAAEERRRPPRRRPGDRDVCRYPRGRDAERHSTEGRSSWAAGRVQSRSFTPANGAVLRPVGVVMRVTVHIVLEQAGAGGGPDFGAPVPNPTTVAAIEAVWRGEVVALGSAAEAIAGLDPHARGSGEQGARRGCRSSGRRSSGAI